MRLLAARPTPEGARLAVLVLEAARPSGSPACTSGSAALGPAPAVEEIAQVLPTAGTDETGGRDEPFASWLRVWAWSPVPPAPLLAGFAPLLAALRRLQPAGPPDPRTAARPYSRPHIAVAVEDLLELAAATGPLAAAAPDAGAAGYALVQQRLVAAAPAAWTADVPQILDVLARPELAAFYLAAASAAPHSDAFPAGPAEAVHPALTLSRALPAPANPMSPTRPSSPAGRGPLCCTLYDAPLAASAVTCRPSSTTCTPSPSPSPAPPRRPAGAPGSARSPRRRPARQATRRPGKRRNCLDQSAYLPIPLSPLVRLDDEATVPPRTPACPSSCSGHHQKAERRSASLCKPRRRCPPAGERLFTDRRERTRESWSKSWRGDEYAKLPVVGGRS
ncbi:hypothetical protein [Streptomyces olivaceoviridis]|uniref:hypothetical protein n=1 Tax=Streptomyces olivaceoviridis TaxID=1921 RepID=UPI00332BEC0D